VFREILVIRGITSLYLKLIRLLRVYFYEDTSSILLKYVIEELRLSNTSHLATRHVTLQWTERDVVGKLELLINILEVT
jgi:hypothetical protein